MDLPSRRQSRSESTILKVCSRTETKSLGLGWASAMKTAIKRLNRFSMNGSHLTLSDLKGVEVDDHIDHRYITEIRIETRRNISGFKMPATISREDRRLVERIAVHCLGYLEHQSIEFEVKGRYFQYGHLEHLAQTIDDNGVKCLYFPLEDRVVYKKAGLLRDWPDARGFWCNSDRTVICNVNEVDHLMFTSTEKTAKLRSVFERHQLILEVFQLRLKQFADKHFAHDKHFGFLTTCPGELGTGTTFFVNMRLKHLVRNQRMFQRVVRKHRMCQQWVADDIWSLYNIDTLGYPESDVLGLMYEGCKKIMELDQFLGSLDSEEWIENEAKLPLRKIAHLIHCDMSWYAPLLFEAGEDEDEMPQHSLRVPTSPVINVIGGADNVQDLQLHLERSRCSINSVRSTATMMASSTKLLPTPWTK